MEIPALAAWLERLPDLCVFKRLTGYPCAGCGMTRAFASVVSGDLRAAFHYNALALPFFAAVLVYAVWRGVDRLLKRDSLDRAMQKLRPHRKWILSVCAVLAALNWAWNIAKGI